MKDDAVSPVVGVMLMLVVTIILAAVFATVSGSVFSGETKTVDAEIIYVKNVSDTHIFEVKSGEPFPLSALKIICYPTGKPTEAQELYPKESGGVGIGDRFTLSSTSLTKPFVYLIYDVNSNLLVSSGEVV